MSTRVVPPKPVVSAENRIVAKSASAVFGGSSSVNRYQDQSGSTQIDVLSCADSPAAGLTAYSTLSLSDIQFKATAEGLPLGVEMVGACLSGYRNFASILSTAALLVSKNRQECQPGAIFEQVVAVNDPTVAMKHLIFVSPFLWGDQPDTLYLDNKAVAWLLAVPISDAELDYALERSVNDLEAVLDTKRAEIYNLNRESAI